MSQSAGRLNPRGDIAAGYKLYDYNRRRWLDVKGHPTSPPAVRTPVSAR